MKKVLKIILYVLVGAVLIYLIAFHNPPEKPTAEEKAYEKGYADGFEDGKIAGYETGYDYGYYDGENGMDYDARP